MSHRTDYPMDEVITQFLRTRSADPDLGLLGDIMRTAGATPQDRPWFGLRPILLPRRTLLIVTFALLLATMGALAVGSGLLVPRSPFAGTWVSTSDAGGGTQTMTVQVSADDAVEIEVHDTIATVCSGTPSTMTGTGRIQGDTALVIPSPVYTCDDGSEPETVSGLPLAVVLRNWTLVLDVETDTLSDGVGGLWFREGAPLPSYPPNSSGGMWPQTNIAEAEEAQQRADAGDTAYTWQLAPEILDGSPLNAKIVDAFIREELGWEAYRFNPFVGWEQAGTNLIYVRCAPGETNPMYPDDDTFGQCAPTIDQFQYETVRIDLLQPIRTEPTGIWVVNRWATATPFAQVDPSIVDAGITARLEAFLDARVAGEGAEGYVEVNGVVEAVPLMYATSSGARFERYLIEQVGVAEWPYGNTDYTIRLFADGGATVVEQPVTLRDGGLYLHATATTENGQPLAVSYSFFGGTVTFAAADPWKVRGGLSDWGALTMGEWWSSTGGIEVVACDPNVALVDAQALARSIQANPDQVATAPVAGRVGGLDGLVIDVSDADLTVCGVTFPSREVAVAGQGTSIRFYLLDLPEGLATRTLVIAIVAPEAGFDAMIEAAAPIIESIEFPAP